MICKYCGSKNVVKYGCNMILVKPKKKKVILLQDVLEFTDSCIKIKNIKAFKPKHIPRQRYRCQNKKCHKTFTHENTYGGFRYDKETIANSIYMLTQTGCGGIEAAKQNKVKARSTIYRWTSFFGKKLEKPMRNLIMEGQYSSERFTDNTTVVLRRLLKNKGTYNNRVIEWLETDNDTRMFTAWHFSHRKTTEEAYKFLKITKKNPRPEFIITDAEFENVIENAYNDGVENAGKPPVFHIPITKSLYKFGEYKGKNNSVERPIMTAKRPLKNTFRIPNFDTVTIRQIWRIAYFNFGRQHLSLGCTPSDEAKIPIERGKYNDIDGTIYDILAAFVQYW